MRAQHDWTTYLRLFYVHFDKMLIDMTFYNKKGFKNGGFGITITSMRHCLSVTEI